MTNNNVDISEVHTAVTATKAEAIKTNDTVKVINFEQVTDDQLVDDVATQLRDAKAKIDAFRNAHEKELNKHSENRQQLTAQGHAIVHRNLIKAHTLAAELIALPVDVLAAILSEHGVSAARFGANPYGPVVKVIYGHWVTLDEKKYHDSKNATTFEIKEKTTETENDLPVTKYYGFKLNRSAEKYAKVLRYANHMGWSAKKLGEELAKQKLKGLMDKDTDQCSTGDPDVQEQANWKTAVLTQPPKMTVEPSEVGLSYDATAKKKRVYGAVWGKFDEKGKFILIGELPMSDDAIDSAVTKMAKANGKVLEKELRVEQHFDAM